MTSKQTLNAHRSGSSSCIYTAVSERQSHEAQEEEAVAELGPYMNIEIERFKKKKKKSRQIKWQQAGQKAVKRELPPVPQALKASELLSTPDIISISIFWVALLSIEPYTDILWFGSVHAATTGSYPVWSTFWFRDESHWGTLKFTAPTLCPVDPELIMTVGTAPPSYINPPPHSPAAVTQAQRAWPRMGVNNWHAGGCGRCCVCHDASAVVLFIWSWESILHAVLCRGKTNLGHYLSQIRSIFKDFFHVVLEIFIFASQKTQVRTITSRESFKLLLLNHHNILHFDRFWFFFISSDC